MASYIPIRKAREITWNMNIPISLSAICRKTGIEMLFSKEMNAIGACYFNCGGRRLIIVNDNTRRERQRFSIAHEIGHFILGHGPLAFNLVKTDEDRFPSQEVQANAFAAELLMPKPYLQHYGYLTPSQIAQICDVSLGAATIRAREFGWLT